MGLSWNPPTISPRSLPQYVRHLVDIDLFHFLKSKKKIHIVYLGVMMGYDLSKGKGANEAIQVLDKLSFLLESLGGAVHILL